MQKKNESIWNQPDFGMRVLKSEWYRMIFELQDVFVKSSMEFYTKKQLAYIPLPITTYSISSPMGLGSDSLPVKVEMKGKEVYLADSMQFLLEYTCRMTTGGCFYLMPSFRGEATDERHLSQFFHSEAEIPGKLEDVIEMIEEYIASLSKEILEHCGDAIMKFTGDLSHLEYVSQKPHIPRITYKDAVRYLENIPGTLDVLSEGIKTINKHGEKALMDRHGGYVWLMYFDERVVPFYQASEKGNAKNADLLMGIGETVGAGQRHKNAKDVREALKRHKVSEESYRWYIEMKEEYPLETSGFGMGMERFLLWVLNHDEIRDCQIVSRIDGSTMEP